MAKPRCGQCGTVGEQGANGANGMNWRNGNWVCNECMCKHVSRGGAAWNGPSGNW